MARSEAQQKRRSEIRSFLNWLKDTRGCGECGARYEGEPYLLEFDHYDGARKRCHPSNLVKQYYSMERVAEAVASTAIRCSICHTRRSRSGTALAESDCIGIEAAMLALEEWRNRWPS